MHVLRPAVSEIITLKSMSRTSHGLGYFAVLLLTASFPTAAQERFSDAEVNAVQAFLSTNLTTRNAGMVIGLLDHRGSRVLSAGKLDNGTDQEVNGDTIFEIGSVTKVFTALLALDMARRGEVKLYDPVSKYLPERVKVPVYEGKEITLRNLAAQDSGLPWNPDNLDRILIRDPNNPSLKVPFAFGVLKTSSSEWTLRGADLQTASTITTAYQGAMPKTISNIGAIVLGVGGDNSNNSWGTFYEGAIVAGYPSDATDLAVFNNIKAVGYNR